MLQQAADQLKQKDIQIEEMKPKALFADAVATSKSGIFIASSSSKISRTFLNSEPSQLSLEIESIWGDWNAK